jgi:hypothetical protein
MFELIKLTKILLSIPIIYFFISAIYQNKKINKNFPRRRKKTGRYQSSIFFNGDNFLIQGMHMIFIFFSYKISRKNNKILS